MCVCKNILLILLLVNKMEDFVSKKTSWIQVPERILDAPDIVNDYYLNLLDWSSHNLLAVGLGCNVYLWNAENGKFQLSKDSY